MTNEEIIKLAREAGFKTQGVIIRTIHSNGSWVGINGELEHFYHVVRNKTLEEAAEKCAEWGEAAGVHLAATIRSMKEPT